MNIWTAISPHELLFLFSPDTNRQQRMMLSTLDGLVAPPASFMVVKLAAISIGLWEFFH